MNDPRARLVARARDELSGPMNPGDAAVRCSDHGRFIMWVSPPAPPCRVACPPECGPDRADHAGPAIYPVLPA